MAARDARGEKCLVVAVMVPLLKVCGGTLAGAVECRLRGQGGAYSGER